MSRAAESGLDEVAIGMSHRGRLNVLANLAGKSVSQIFAEFEGTPTRGPCRAPATSSTTWAPRACSPSESGATTRVHLAANPSHLEAVDPVLEGIVRAKQDRIDLGGDGFSVLPILIHGDAAFAGQGVVYETLNLAQLRGYRTGGTVHVIVNNQVGFTTGPSSSRSTHYCTDVAKGLQVPIFHVNGDDPEACVRVAELAFEFREQFDRDVIVDMICYRRRGHNEGDDPSMTQPLMYNLIEAKRSTRKLYTEALVSRGDITVDEASEALAHYQAELERVFTETREAYTPAPDTEPVAGLEKPESQLEDAGTMVGWRTAVEPEVLERIGRAHLRPPAGFTVHPKLVKLLQTREQMSREGGVDWGFGELLAFGSLLMEGTPVRLAGQDSRRGTFVQRHAVLHDRTTGAEWTPLLYLSADQAKFWIYDSSLSEYAAMGFEYGYSVERPDALVLWEAQFGDFANGAQTIIDEFISSAGQKWGQRSSVVLLLPHGFEGQGPGPLVGAHRAVPAAVRRGEHDRRDADHAGVVLPPAAPAGLPAPAPAARGVHAQVDAPAEGRDLGDRRLHHRHVPTRGPRGEAARRRRRPRAAVLGQGLLGPARAPRRRSATHAPRSSGSSSCTRWTARESPRRSPRTAPPSSSGCRRSRPTRAPGRTSRSACPSRWAATCAGSPGRRPRHPRRDRPRCTPSSSGPSSSRPSPAEPGRVHGGCWAARGERAAAHAEYPCATTGPSLRTRAAECASVPRARRRVGQT